MWDESKEISDDREGIILSCIWKYSVKQSRQGNKVHSVGIWKEQCEWNQNCYQTSSLKWIHSKNFIWNWLHSQLLPAHSCFCGSATASNCKRRHTIETTHFRPCVHWFKFVFHAHSIFSHLIFMKIMRIILYLCRKHVYKINSVRDRKWISSRLNEYDLSFPY